nr:metal-sensing transcriptional repressor [uncultured Ralstonia sp.]
MLQQLAAIRGAIIGLMTGVLESHLREAFTQLDETTAEQQASIDNVASPLRSYLR